MSMLLKTWTPSDVQNAPDSARAFCEYVQQLIGVPYPTGKEIAIVRKKSKEFFEHYPHTDWFTLCRVAAWCRARKRRPSHAHKVIDQFRYAWSAGVIPELNQTQAVDEDIEQQIADALAVETREGWRRRLTMAQSPDIRKKVIAAWRTDRLTSSSSR